MSHSSIRCGASARARSFPAETGSPVRRRRSAFQSTFRSLAHPFQKVFEVVEAALPEPGHSACPVDQRGQGAKLRAIVRLATFVAVTHQPGLLQDPKML